MWQTKRKVKKEKVHVTKKYILYGVVGIASLSVVSFGVIHIAAIIQKPLFVSPVPKQAPLVLHVPKEEKDITGEAIIGLLAKNNISVASFSAKPQYYHLSLTTGEEVLFSKEKPLDIQLSSLQLVLSQLTIEGKKLQTIDFRFDKPVVLFR